MILLSVDEIKALHSKLIQKTGGSDGIRDENLLESAVYSALASFLNEECYPTVEEKAARLMFSLTNNHAFLDGNKRIGVLVMLMTLKHSPRMMMRKRPIPNSQLISLRMNQEKLGNITQKISLKTSLKAV